MERFKDVDYGLVFWKGFSTGIRHGEKKSFRELKNN
jgi:hypothetical protein